ncbi:MAG: response regulator [Acidobacteriota bacterium]|nr:response regulator [Acidobacteriota bacterium]
MKRIKILLVDDDELVLSTLCAILQQYDFETTSAASVPEALSLISANSYDVLLSDLHMPGAGDGLTVVSAMRHAQPKAVTMLLSAFPEMDAASRAIMLQADQILVKPMDVTSLIAAIKERLAIGAPVTRVVESVATILERTTKSTIQDWYARAQKDEAVMSVAMTFEQRTSHLPQVFRDLVHRLRSFESFGSKELESPAAVKHGLDRREQGYSAAMLVEESRILQVSVFHTLQKNLARIDFSVVLKDVMTIADEIDSQLAQAMTSFISESAIRCPPNHFDSRPGIRPFSPMMNIPQPGEPSQW